MKKLLIILSSLACSFVSQVIAQPLDPYYADRCIVQSENSYAGHCPNCVGYSPNYNNENGVDRYYAGAFGGVDWLHTGSLHGIHVKNKAGYAVGIFGGYKFDNSFRVEGELAYRKNNYHVNFDNYDKIKIASHISTFTYMVNVLYDFEEVSNYIPNVVPYLGVGAGYGHQHAHVKVKDDSEYHSANRNSNGFVAQGIAGIGYRLTESTTLGVEYRYLMRKEPLAHSVGLSLKQMF